MSVYPSTGDIYGWNSDGRRCAMGAAISFAFAAGGYWLTHGTVANRLNASDQLFAWVVQWVGVGLFVLLAAVAVIFIINSFEERGDVEVTELGVRKIFRSGREEFFPLQEIEGFAPQLYKGVLLVGKTGTRQMIIPRSIEDYRACIGELKSIGIEPLPAKRLKEIQKITFREMIFWSIATSFAISYFERRPATPEHHTNGVLATGLFLTLVVLNERKKKRYRWGIWLGAAIFLAAVIYRW